MKFGDFIIAAGITSMVLFVSLYQAKLESPSVKYESTFEDLKLTHIAPSVVRGTGNFARLDVVVDGGLIPDTALLSLYLRLSESAVDTLFKRAPMLTVPGRGLLYRRDLTFPGLGKEFEYFFRLETHGDSAKSASTLATIPQSQEKIPNPTLRIRFIGVAAAGISIAHATVMFAALFLFVLSMMFVLIFPGNQFGLTRGVRTALVGIILFAVGNFVLGIRVESAISGAAWHGFPLGTDVGDTLGLIILLYWLQLILLYKKSITGGSPELSASATTVRALFVFGVVLVVGAYLIPGELIRI